MIMTLLNRSRNRFQSKIKRSEYIRCEKVFFLVNLRFGQQLKQKTQTLIIQHKIKNPYNVNNRNLAKPIPKNLTRL
jgi:hypothetical protein